MQKFIRGVASAAFVCIVFVCVASPAQADDRASARDIQRALDNYVAQGGEPATLVGGVGSAGYSDGFWIRGGDFLLRTNLGLRPRWEAMDWDQNEPSGFTGGGDLSGFSLPRATLKLSGEAPCNTRYYMELEFGHSGLGQRELVDPNPQLDTPNLGPTNQSNNFDNTREAWIEWGCSDALNIRMGQIRTPTTRQAMTSPELQQFVDVSLATSWVGLGMPGYTDRNRDHGVMLHGVLGCSNELSWMATVTNGDGGDSIRNVLDPRTSDNLAFGARVNWAFWKPIGFQEGAIGQDTCSWYGELGAWGYYYADRSDKNHAVEGDYLRWGVDLAVGLGGFSMTAAVSFQIDDDVPAVPGPGTLNDDTMAYLIQAGYHFPGTAWEIAARYSGIDFDGDQFGTGSVTEIGVGVNYYLNGHGSKFQIDASFITTSDGGFLIYDRYPGYGNFLGGDEDQDAILLRFQWQLAI